MSWIVNERENDWSLTSLNALIVTDWDDTDWEGVPDIIPVDEMRDRPIGRDPDVIENESSSPLTVGMIETGSSLDRTYDDWGYENEEIGVITVNERTTVSIAVPLIASIVTDWEESNWEGDPEMTPVDGLIDRPLGSDPETVEIVETLVRLGVIEKDSPWPMMRLVWGYEMRDEMISIDTIRMKVFESEMAVIL